MLDAGSSTSTAKSPLGARRPSNTVITVITEQPVPRVRFRNKTDNLSGSQIYGVNATPENLTYPTIRVKNYTGRVLIVVSCVTTDYRVHPNKLVGHKGCKENSGVCIIRCNVESGAQEYYTFKNLSIQLVRRDEVKQALEAREKVKIDPFNEGYEHRGVNLYTLRLAFQVFLDERTELPPVTSDIIRHHQLEVFGDLVVKRMSTAASPFAGGVEIFMFCNKVPKDTVVEFYEIADDGAVLWSATVSPCYLGKDGLIVETPPYQPASTKTYRDSVNVWLRLERKRTNQFSAPLSFEYFPTPGDITKKKTLLPNIMNYCKSLQVQSNDDYLASALAWQRQTIEGAPANPIFAPHSSVGLNPYLASNSSAQPNNPISSTNYPNPTSP